MKRKQASHSAAPQHPDSHYQHLKNAIPDWLGQASPARHQALKSAQPLLTDRLKAVPAEHHQQMKALNAAHWSAQNEVDQQLAHLQDANAFAEPLLKAALKSRFGLDLDVRTTFIQLYVPATVPWFPIKTGARAWTVSLLDAALHNFEAHEAEDDAYEAHSTFITAPTETCQFDTLPAIKQKISIPTFIRLCRELDIGAQYASHLNENLGIGEPVAAAVLQLKVTESQKAAMKAALQWARMNGDISEECLRLIGGQLDELQGMRIDGQALLCQELRMLSASLTGIMVFAPDLEQSRQTTRVVVYVPDDPEHPFKEYASSKEMIVELIRQLRSKDYQTFFSRFVDHEKRGIFFANLNHRLSKIAWHEPIPGSGLPAWQETPIDIPNLQFAITPIDTTLWQHLYQSKLNKILNDGRVIAVSTASADQKSRWALWDSFVAIASGILQTVALIVAPFVPVLGEAMMAYMAYQLLDETFEWIIDWAEGLTSEAFEHFMNVLESLVELGIFAAGGAIGAGELRKVLPKEVVAFIDRFKLVERPDGKNRYWKPDLANYEQKTLPAPDALPDKLGLYPHQQKQLLPVEGAHYAVSEGPVAGQYRIDHPSRADAYKPVLRHNGEGAWHTELEQPLEWDTATALRRIGPAVDGFSPARREQILNVSGCTEDALRKMHVNQEPLPPLLADSIKRFRIDQDLEQFIEQLDSEVPEQYLKADPLTQLQLLAEHDRWPPRKRLRWVDENGDIAWTSSNDETLPLTVLRQDKLLKGDPLKTLLQSFDEGDVKSLLGEEPNGPELALEVRARALRKQLVNVARQRRTSMFESRYAALESTDDPLAHKLAQHDPQLPASLTRELINTASTTELLQINEGVLPERQQTLMQLANQEVRVTRAFEGLELDSLNNPDTDTLALHSLQRLPGWSGEVRIELRDGDYEGQMLDSTGRADAPEQKVLVRQPNGKWQPYNDRGEALSSSADFYTSILQALPDSERRALDIHVGQGTRLKDAIRARPMERSELRVAISPRPIPVPVVDTLRLVGTDGYPRIVNSPGLTLQERAREIYPGHSPEEIQTLIAELQNHPAGVRAELSRLNSEYTRLAYDLHRWANDIPDNDPITGLALTPAQRQIVLRNRANFKDAIERCWRKETRTPTGHVLQVEGPLFGDFPVLNADLSHVSTLSVAGGSSPATLESFLQSFPRLQHLRIEHFPLPNLPSAIRSMPTLRQLIVRNSGITLSATDQQTLAALRELSLLDLQGNPLALTPNIHTLPSLRYLDLSHTGITAPPARLMDHPQLTRGLFTDNQISELPPELFTLDSDLADGFDFGNNPLTSAMRERVKIYYARTAKHFGILPEQADIDRVIALFPDRDIGHATDLLYRMPGTLAQGRARLTEWEAEITRLTSDLSRWSADVPQRHPGTGNPLNLNETISEQIARETFSQQLQQFWRNRLVNHPDRFKSNLNFMGDMPVLTADFSHVQSLTLTGNTNVSATTPLLQSFSGLRSLNMKNFSLEQIPQAITRMPELETLTLENCGVVLNAESQAALASLQKLEVLDLSHNPLGTPPDLTTLPKQLTHLDLSHTGISDIPVGLAEHPPQSAIFNNNLLSELPQTLFNLPPNHLDGFDFSDNPLSLASRERIKNLFRWTGQDLCVWADKADIDLARELFPALDAQDASDMIYDLPGTLEDGRIQLRHWKAEFTQLHNDLTAWARDVSPYDPLTGQPRDANQMYADYVSRTEFQQALERFWRRRSDSTRARETVLEANLTFSGDMPRLTTDFRHVSSVTLNGNATIGDPHSFLELFPNVHTLQLYNFSLNQVPAAITRMPGLKALTLRSCQMPLTTEGQAMLSSLGNLESLDLSGNPLGSLPDLSALRLLNDLRLSNTGIASLPHGFTTLEHLSCALLDGNLISHLPDTLFSLDADFIEQLDLANNPLSESSRNKIKTHYSESNSDFLVLADQNDINRLQALFPQLDTEDASHVIYKLPGSLEDGRTQLTQWEGEVARLTHDLSAWADDVPAQHPTTAQPLSDMELTAERNARNTFADNLVQFWREREIEKPEQRAQTFTADLSFIGEMPELTADFSHVSELSLNGNSALGTSASFLECFTGLQHLEMRDINLGRVPQAISRMPSLQRLVLSRCGVVLDAEGQAALASSPHLSQLDLFDNPLQRVPDLASLPTLRFIDLSSTGIDRVPPGLLNHPLLETAILSHNQITELPEELFNLPAEASDGFDFSHNPLSTPTRERIKIYFRQTDDEFGVQAPLADIDQTIELYPELDVEQASKFIYRLPGTLADGRTELARKKAELTDLISDLEVWTTNIPDHPITGQPLSGEELLQEQLKRRTFKENLELCWRRAPTENASTRDFSFTSNLSITGDLPVLTADFGHVLELFLTTTGDIAPSASTFLEYFPNLTSLGMRGYQLDDIPQAVFKMNSLTALSLPECRITLSRNSRDALAGMSNLDTLDLSGNPLRRTPELRNLQQLSMLNLSNTGIRDVPKGLFDIPNLTQVDLSGNAITEMPSELMEANPDLTMDYDFSGNPFTAQSLQRIAAYFHETGNTLGIDAVAGMPRPGNLPPDVEMES
ncbi:hypothetical protein HNO86_24865 [Pseudomonas sp. C1C7]|uniref:dermonecrotic toxin domain-containing protein n=1 Tax=Pseudomonas sp. C1C7 TaxID=2735272 RepID=UPI001585E60B|nr:DUF6543 domain-containing protein [Pseudomonas sp. C1C7]NUT78275.1 hypothetical protein [Pseudomonas sp. C1C7]